MFEQDSGHTSEGFTSSILALDGIYFAFPGEAPLFENLSFNLPSAERVGLYGPNGCGKTTLFRLLTGLEKPSRGRVLLHGEPVLKEEQWRTLRCKAGLVLQNADDQLFCPTVLDDVAFGPLNLGLKPEEARERALTTLAAIGLEGFEERLTHRLSGGEKKMVCLAAVLAMRPEALLLDEPTNGLDPRAEEHFLEMLQKLPTAKVVISHDARFLEACCTRFFTLRCGQLYETAGVER